MVVREPRSLQKLVDRLDCECLQYNYHFDRSLEAVVASYSYSYCSRADLVNIAAARMALVAGFAAAAAAAVAGRTFLLEVAYPEMTLRLDRMRVLCSVADK